MVEIPKWAMEKANDIHLNMLGMSYRENVEAIAAALAEERDRAASELGAVSAELEFCRFGNSLLLAKLKAHDALLRQWEGYGCPDCGGDCASANPPISLCIMRETRNAIRGGSHE